MDEYRNAVVTRLRELEEEFKESDVSYSRTEIAREVPSHDLGGGR